MNKDQRENKNILQPVLICLIAAAMIISVISLLAQHNFIQLPDLFGGSKDDEVLLIDDSVTWAYLDGGAEPGVGNAWTLASYDHNGWKTGKEPFTFDNSGTKLNVSGAGSSSSYYFFCRLQLDNVSDITAIQGTILYKDAAIVYLNGQIVFAGNVPENGYTNNMNTGAAQTLTEIQKDNFTITDLASLKKGENIVAVELHRQNAEDTDPWMNLTASASREEDISVSAPDTSRTMLLNGDDEHSVAVNLLDTDEGYYQVKYIEKDNYDEKKKKAINGSISSELMGRYDTNGTADHRALLTGLKTGTEYLYSISHVGSKTATDWMSFTTPNTISFTAIIIGDPQLGINGRDDSALWQTASQAWSASYSPADYIYCIGDIIDGSGNNASILKSYQAYRAPSVFQTIPSVNVKGNHDKADDANDLFNLQFKSGDYSYTIQNTLVAILDTNNTDIEKHAEFLRKAVQDNPRKWVIVLMHESLFSSGVHTDDDALSSGRKAYAELFQSCNVDIVISGHDHIYSRSKLMEGMNAIDGTDTNDLLKQIGQTLYITVGSSSGTKYYSSKESLYYTAELFSEQTETASKLTVNGDSLSVETRRLDTSEIIDNVTLKK